MSLLFVAVLIMRGGAEIVAPMASESICVQFTREIALHVESANCYTIPLADIRAAD